MSRRAAGFVLGLAAVLLVGGIAWWLLAGRSGGGDGGGRAGAEEAGGPGEPVSFVLYFPTDGGALAGERRELQVTETPRDRASKIAQAVLAGPKSQGLYRPFDPAVRVASVEIADGVVYLDLVWDGHDEPPASGATEEIQRVYSLVNSVCLNVPEAQRAVLLWNSFQRLTFAGHLDLSEPLGPDRSLLAR